MSRPGLTDPALAFFLRKLRESQTEGKRVGLRQWCRDNGILAPEHIESIERYEVSFSDLPPGKEPTSE